MPAFSKTVIIARPPDVVFPWLFDPDKVPRWTTRLDVYEIEGGGSVAAGSHIRQVIATKSQKLDVDVEITRYDPPAGAASRFSLHGIDVTTAYRLVTAGGGTELTQELEGKAGGIKGRVLLPIVQGPLEEKITEDLERLRALLDAGG